MIPLANPRASYFRHKDEIDSAISRVMNGGAYILGKEVERFENRFANYVLTKSAIGVASGTDALFLSMKALGIGKGDEVITVSHTAVATVAAIVMTGATPVLVDIGPHFTMDSNKIQITKNTKAIIPVHLYGNQVDVRKLLKFKVPIIEDCAQSSRAQVVGDVGCFSFYPTKNLGCFGDGGMIATNNRRLYEKIKLLRQYGWKKRYVSKVHGYNSRLDEIQAAILNVKLKYIDEDLWERRRIAFLYDNLLNEKQEQVSSEFHLYVIRSKKRDKLSKYLEAHDVQTAVHYPVPIHKQPGYKNLVRVSGSMENTEQAAREVLSLPMYPGLKDEEIHMVAKLINRFR